MGNEANAIQEDCSENSIKNWSTRYSDVMSFIRKRLRFDLLKTTTIALRGDRGKRVGAADEVAELDINLEPIISDM